MAYRQRTVWEVLTDHGSVMTGISSALRRLGRFPAAGNFVVLHNDPEAGSLTIVDILPQKTVFTRGASDRKKLDQVIAADIDTIFTVTADGPDPNALHIERYLAIAHASGARPL